ncbi:type VI secretion system-associated protein TagF, partial [Dyella sp.]|uniref:type VI secretion system-associated protein TagF n=1 Tax=Dyella sp. TaxID=1869338 RepID=UPI002D78C5C7
MATGAAGFFGKLPGAGDFVQRRLPSPFVDAWDQHFERAVNESKLALGDAWQHAYRSSPTWRFVLSPGVCTSAAWAGVMGPANDRVGRSFPMVIATPLDDAWGMVRDGDAWFG